MAADSGARLARRAKLSVGFAVLAWASCAVWNSIKPLPPGTHVTSLPARLAESQLDFIDGYAHRGELLARELEAVGRAERLVVLDQCPLALALAQRLLLRKRQQPNLQILLVTDPRNEVYGGTPARTLNTLEAAGIVLARARLTRLRDSSPWYSSLWRLGVGWWSNPFDEVPGQVTLSSTLRNRNRKADRRQLLVADDGAGGWTSIVMSGAGNTAAAGIELRGHLARDIVASELRIAAWSTDDDRLPRAPPTESRGVGSVDARFVTEGAIHTVLRDAIDAAGNGDSLDVAVDILDDVRLVDAMVRAAARGVRLRLLLDPAAARTRAAAGELERNRAGNVEVRWQDPPAPEVRFALIRHRSDVWIHLGSASFDRRGLGDLDLEAGVELRMPARAAAARAAIDAFTRQWSSGTLYAAHAEESGAAYAWYRLWYRLAAGSGLSMF